MPCRPWCYNVCLNAILPDSLVSRGLIAVFQGSFSVTHPVIPVLEQYVHSLTDATSMDLQVGCSESQLGLLDKLQANPQLLTAAKSPIKVRTWP